MYNTKNANNQVEM